MIVKAYDLSFDLDFQQLNYKCIETIHIEDPTSSITLDCLGPDISRIQADGKSVPFRLDKKSAKLVIEGATRNRAVEIAIEFSGKVSDNSLFGFYKSKYHDGYILTTDLEPQGARTVFPCFDDPNQKAEFNLEIKIDKDLDAISNMPQSTSEDLGQGKKRVRFERTPRMSTYLFFLGVGKFEVASRKDGNVEFLVATRPDQAIRGIFSLDNCVRFLRAYEKYFSVPYPLPKMHLISLPEYASGAMENWGAITFREVRLFVDENSSADNRRRVVAILGHELAHQWFGDLVTMKWWNDIWLNESFATFLEQKMTTMLYPDSDALADFVKKETVEAMDSDSLLSTHPIDVKVESPEEIAQIFDRISYGKGASVIRMFESFVGEDAFRHGVSNYLKEYSYGNAEGKDLWRHVEKVSSQPISSMMESWVKRPGYPVIRVRKKQSMLSLEQDRFLLNGKPQGEPPWPIPIALDANGDRITALFDESTREIPLDSKLEKLKLNARQTGFYRVLYDKELYGLIDREFEELSLMDRWGILGDLAAFVVSGQAEISLYLSFAKKCNEETEYIVADAVSDQLHMLRRIAPANEELLQSYSLFHLSQARRLGMERNKGEKETDGVLRSRIFARLALVDDPEYSAELANRFGTYETLDPDLRSAAAIAYARRYESEAFGPMVAMMKKIGSEADYIRIYEGLSSFKSGDLIKKALDLSVSEEINRADSFYAVLSTRNNPSASEASWRWLSSNVGKLMEIFPGTYVVSDLMERLIPWIGLGFEDEVREFGKKANLESARSGFNKGVEMLEVFSNARRRMEDVRRKSHL